MKGKEKLSMRTDENGSVAVEACTSLIIFILAFYMIMETIQVFAVQACMQDVLTTIALDASMAEFYGDRESESIADMPNLIATDNNDIRYSYYINSATKSSSIKRLSDDVLNYYIDGNSNLKRFFARDKVDDFIVLIEPGGSMITVRGHYWFRLIEVPFLEDECLEINLRQSAATAPWKSTWW